MLTRLLDFVAHVTYWCAGMYWPGPGFSRTCWDCVTYANNAGPGASRQFGVVSRDLDGPESADGVPVRVYEQLDPAVLGDARPVLLWLHGGGFCIGDRSLRQMDELCMRFAALGMSVVSVSYALAPEHPFPAATRDCYRVLRWLHSPASFAALPPSRCDRSRFVLAGDSAGGNLACALAALNRDGLDADLRPETGARVHVAYLLLLYPALFMQGSARLLRSPSGDAGAAAHARAPHDEDLRRDARTPFIPQPVRRWFTESYVPGGRRRLRRLMATDQRLTPLLFGAGGLPPTTLVAAGLDVLRHENAAAAAAMRAAGSPCVFRSYEDVPHGFVTFSFLDEAHACFADIARDLTRVGVLARDERGGDAVPDGRESSWSDARPSYRRLPW